MSQSPPDPLAQPLADSPMAWPVLSTRDLHRDRWVVALREDTVARPGAPDDTFSRLCLEHPGAVVVLAVNESEEVMCLRQYRHAAGHDFIELPAGLRDAGDEPAVVTAQRELREEVQLEASSWRLLLSTYPSAGITDEVHEIFLAQDLIHAPRGEFEMRHEEAAMTSFWVPMSDLLDAVVAGRVREGPLAQAVLIYDLLKRRGQLT